MNKKERVAKNKKLLKTPNTKLNARQIKKKQDLNKAIKQMKNLGY